MNEPLFSVLNGWSLLGVYALVMMALVPFISSGLVRNKAEFLVAGRRLGSWASAFSIAATWIWAPALFIAAQKAYTQGFAGVFWFTVPNVLCLVLFGYFAQSLRKRFPDGYTLSGFIRERYSGRVQGLYLVQLIGLALCSFAVQLLAGGVLISALTGIPFWQVTLALSAIALSYSAWSGLRASVVTDYVQMVLIAVTGLVLVPWVIASAGGWEAVAAGLGGHTGNYASIFSAGGAEVFFGFGIAVTIGLMSGPFGDQSFYQRAFGTWSWAVRGAFIKGALIFALVPVLMSLLGFVAAGTGIQVSDEQLVNLEAVLAYLPAWTAIPFTFMLLSGLVSTLDSNLCAVSSMAGHDLAQLRQVEPEGASARAMGVAAGDSDLARAVPLNEPKGGSADAVVWARWGMFGLALGAIAIANLPGMKILYLFLFYGTLRASTFLPTVLSVLSDRTREAAVFWGILLAIGIGLPVFAYGNFTGNVPWTIAGSLLTVLLSGGVAWVGSAFANRSPSPALGQA